MVGPGSQQHERHIPGGEENYEGAARQQNETDTRPHLLTFEVEGASGDGDRTLLKPLFSPTAFLDKYLKDPNAKDDAGEQTRLIRQKFVVQEKKRSRKYIRVIIATGVLALVASAYAVYKHMQVHKQEVLAQEAFYDMKALDIAYASLKKQLGSIAGDTTAHAEVGAYL